MLFYFIPTTAHKTDCPPELLAEYFLDAVIDSPIICQTRNGPNGQPGLIVVDAEVSKNLVQYDPRGQTWTQSLDTDAWIGYAGKTPPRVASLARRDMLPGRSVKLTSGETIQVPVAQRFVDVEGRLYTATALPQALGRDRDTKQWIPKTIVAKYQTLWNHLQGYIAAQETALREADVEPGESVWFEYAGLHDLTIAALTANYRIAHDEVEILGIYDQSTQSKILAVLTDQETRDAWVKKKLAALTSDGSIFADGPTQSTTESTTDTPQP